MYCSLGTEKPNLTVTSQTFHRISDALVGTEGDNKGMVNIPSFGVCKCSSPNSPCTPQPQTRLATNKYRKTVSMNC
nr:PAAR-like protein [uncultured Prevotella sp.]